MSYDFFKAVREELQRVFDAATKERGKRNEMVFDPMENRPALGWIVFEREQLFEAVNRLRHTDGKPPVDMKAIWRAEISASGHSDYYRKYPLYCAEIVVKDSHVP